MRNRPVLLVGALLLWPSAPAAAQDTALVVREVHGGPSTAYRVVTFPVEVAKFPLVVFGAGLRETLTWAETQQILGRFGEAQAWLAARGFAVRAGGLGEHSGFGAGLAWAWPRSGPVVPEASVAITHWGYMDHRVALRWAPSGAVGVRLGAGFDRNTRDEFYGIGGDAPRDGRSDFQREEWSAGAEARIVTARRLSIGLGAGWRSETVERGTHSGLPDTQDLFTAETAPGLLGTLEFLRYGLALTWDARDLPADPRSGAYLSASGAYYDGTAGTDARFVKLHAEARGYLPLGGLRRVLALRVATELTRPDGDGPIPFYLLSSLGGGASLRGFEGGRFHDRDALLLTAEYRYRIWREHRGRAGVDLALFLDEGAVVRSLSRDLRGARFHPSWGLGLQAATTQAVLLRVELARSPEQTRLNVVAGTRF